MTTAQSVIEGDGYAAAFGLRRQLGDGWKRSDRHVWLAVPCASDIAFALDVISHLDTHIPRSLKVFCCHSPYLTTLSQSTSSPSLVHETYL